MSIYYLSLLQRANNNSGVVNKAFSDSSVLNNVPAILNPEELPFGSTVIDGDNTDPAIPLGTFAFSNNDPIIKGFTTTLNGSDTIRAVDIASRGNAAPDLTSSIHPVSSVRTRLETTAQRDGRFNGFTGKYDAGYPDTQLDDLGLDIAATPTRENPGRIHYIQGKRLVSSSYEKKTG